MQRFHSFGHILLISVLSYLLLVQAFVSVTDVHIASDDNVAVMYHTDALHDHEDGSHHHDSDNAHENHCCHAHFANISLAVTSLPSKTLNETATSFPLRYDEYRDPELNRFKRPPKFIS